MEYYTFPKYNIYEGNRATWVNICEKMLSEQQWTQNEESLKQNRQDQI